MVNLPDSETQVVDLVQTYECQKLFKDLGIFSTLDVARDDFQLSRHVPKGSWTVLSFPQGLQAAALEWDWTASMKPGNRCQILDLETPNWTV